MNILFLDIETTGIDPKNSAILEIAAALYLEYIGNNPIATFHRKVRYHGIPQTSLGALAVNKVKLNDMIGTLSKEFYPEPVLDFADWLVELKAKYGEFVVCGQNVNFDLSFLETKLNEYGITDLKALTGYRVLDIASVGLFLKLAELVKAPKPSGEELAKEFGVELAAHHTAIGDIGISERVLYKMFRLVKP